MKEITIQIDGQDFIIDIDRAKELGVVKENTIKSFKVGDVFKLASGTRVIIVQNGYGNDRNQRYNIAGNLNTLDLFSDIGEKGFNKREMLQFLNKPNSWQPNERTKFIKNVNEDLKKWMYNL